MHRPTETPPILDHDGEPDFFINTRNQVSHKGSKSIIEWPSISPPIEESKLDALIKQKKLSELAKQEDMQAASEIDFDASEPTKSFRASMSKRKMLHLKAELYQHEKPSLSLLDQQPVPTPQRLSDLD